MNENSELCEMKFSCKNIFGCLSYVPLNLLFLFNWWLEQICLIWFFLFFFLCQFYILFIQTCNFIYCTFCEIGKTTKHLCTISCYYGWKFNTTDPVSWVHAYLEGKGGNTAPHHNGPPPNEHIPKQPCIWTRTTQIIHTIYLIITIRYFANSFRYF